MTELTRQDITDIALIKGDDGIYDMEIGDDGDFVPVYGFDTSIIISLFVDKMANGEEVVEALQRRGWIGNESNDVPGFEIGSKLWLTYQARNNAETRNQVVDAAKSSLLWLVDDGYLTDLNVTGALKPEGIELQIIFVRKSGKIDKLYFKLWENTVL
ncbi:MAG: phage GP46 family protein [Candidatus Peribacteraceae bacterium]|nr:phage GP46 family protein [Candidatus Peribacteraceae bacterium]